MFIAEKTLALIAQKIEEDQGASFRELLGVVMPKMEDAYRGASKPFRTHLGVSLIGKECARDLWYSFRWCKKPHFDGKTLRLFNRGHLEEARFIAMLQVIGCALWYETETGGQFRVSEFGGHFGSALDGVGRKIPDLHPEQLAYTEFKTSSNKNFNKLKKYGLMEEKMQHYVQMQVCMEKYDLPFGLYMVVNKDNDELYAEIIELDREFALSYKERANRIIFDGDPPPRIANSKAFFKCRFCDFKNICHDREKPEINCRTCCHSTPLQDGTWACSRGWNDFINSDEAMIGCVDHIYNPNLLNGVSMVDGNFEENYIDITVAGGEAVRHGPNHVDSVSLCLGKKGKK